MGRKQPNYNSLHVYIQHHNPDLVVATITMARWILKLPHSSGLFLPAAGVYHRDIKPVNVLVRGNGGCKYKWADFGLSRVEFELVGGATDHGGYTTGSGPARKSEPFPRNVLCPPCCPMEESLPY